jgi:hypothetical protein
MKKLNEMRCGLTSLAVIVAFALTAGAAMAQTTPLRIMSPQARRCVASCQARTQSCYQHATSGGARENCEVNGSHCKRGC